MENKIYTTFAFKIEPPYWEKWWFYAAEVAFFLSLLIASFYFGTRKRGHKVSIILAITTLLIVFEFVNENIIEGYIEQKVGNVTIFKVIANVALAAVVSPIEKLIYRILSAQNRPKEEDPVQKADKGLWQQGEKNRI